MEKAIDDLQGELNTLEGKLADLKNAAADQWQKLSGDVESGLSSLRDSATGALERFK